MQVVAWKKSRDMHLNLMTAEYVRQDHISNVRGFIAMSYIAVFDGA